MVVLAQVRETLLSRKLKVIPLFLIYMRFKYSVFQNIQNLNGKEGMYSYYRNYKYFEPPTSRFRT